MLSNFCEVGGGFSILKKDDFRADPMTFPAFNAVTGTYECTFLKYNKVSAINL